MMVSNAFMTEDLSLKANYFCYFDVKLLIDKTHGEFSADTKNNPH
jgi:hypothetical protein